MEKCIGPLIYHRLATTMILTSINTIFIKFQFMSQFVGLNQHQSMHDLSNEDF